MSETLIWDQENLVQSPQSNQNCNDEVENTGAEVSTVTNTLGLYRRAYCTEHFVFPHLIASDTFTLEFLPRQSCGELQ